MPTLTQSDEAKLIKPVPHPAYAGHAVTHRYTVTVPANAAQNDIFEIACCPAGCRVAEIVADSDDLDSDGAPALLLDIGFLSGDWGDDDDTRIVDDNFFDGINLGQAGGVARPTQQEAYEDAGAAKARGIGAKIATAAATGQAGTLGLTVTVVSMA
jgi:hypothetical protein